MCFIVAARVAEKSEHIVYGHKIEVHLVDTASAIGSLVPQASTITSTILVEGLMEYHTESTLKLFFTNTKKCGGGNVTKVSMKEDSAYVSFADPKGSQHTKSIAYSC